MNLLAPIALGLASLAIPLVVLYMLRSRRRRVEVPSTLLWEQVGAPVSSAVPWQKLRLTPLLLLQLLVLAALVFTLARPFYSQDTLLGPHTVMVFDVSGSMAMAGRLERAKERALTMVADISEANLVSVVEAGAQPRVLAGLSRDPDLVIAAITSLQATGGNGDLSAAIRLGRGLATPDRPTSLLIFSDGGTDPLPEEPVAGARQVRIDDFGPNVGVSAWSIEPSTEGSLRAFLQLSNYGGDAKSVAAEVAVNGLPAGVVTLELPGLGEARQTIPVDAGPGDVVTVQLLDTEDSLSLDDESVLVVGGGPERKVGLSSGSPFLAALIEAAPGFTGGGEGEPELLVVDGGASATIDRPAWVIATETPPAGITPTELVRNTVVTWQRPGEPILDGVDLSQVAVAEAQVVDAPGWLPLVRAGDVPLVLLGEVEGQRVAYFTFDISKSNLPVQIGFPILGARLLDWLAGAGAGTVSSETAGTPIALSAPAGTVPRVTLPDASTRDLPPEAASFADTGLPGLYRVDYLKADGTSSPGPMAVRTFVSDESAGASRQIATADAPGAPQEAAQLIREWAPWFIGLVLLLMAIEWWVGHQRPGLRRKEAMA
ncbi:MAG TPA: BatA and WFA domain-containing protein [Acidimicrobiia bacterium]|jgi:hypothetical protein